MIQLQFINYLLASGDSSLVTLNNLNKDFFSDYTEEYKYITEHLQQYGNVPGTITFLDKFPDFDIIEVNESADYLVDKLYKDKNTINDVADLKRKRTAVQIGTSGAKKKKKIEGAKITSFNTNGEACLELKNKAVDAVIGDLPVEAYFLQQGGNDFAKIVGKTLSSEDYGIAVAKSNTALAKEVDKALDTLKQNGEYDKLYKKWFGEMPKK